MDNVRVSRKVCKIPRIVYLLLTLHLSGCSVQPVSPPRVELSRQLAHGIQLGETEQEVFNKLGDPAYVVGSKQFSEGPVRIYAYRFPTEEWLYFWNDAAVEWGVPGDWDIHADRIHEVNQSSTLTVPVQTGMVESLGSAFRLSDAQKAEAERVVHAWLKLVDAGDAEGSWQSAGELFRSDQTIEDWKSVVGYLRENAGKLQKRKFVSSSPFMVYSSWPKGDYLHFAFDSEFEKKPTILEGVAVKLEPDQTWHVVLHTTAY